MDIAVIGTQEFTLGFRLAGISKVVSVDENPDKAMAEMMNEKNLGILITDEKTMGSLSERMRYTVESSVKPVAVVVSTESTAQDALRKMIIKSIGVDLWKE